MRSNLSFLLLVIFFNLCFRQFVFPVSIGIDKDSLTWSMLKKQLESHQQKKPDSVFYLLKMADSYADLHQLSVNDQLFLLNSWGDYYAEIQVADSAIMFFERAMHKSKDSSDQNVLYGQVLRLADAFNNNYISDSALKYYRTALVYYREINDSLTTATALSGIASALIESENYKEALEKLYAAENIYKNTTKHRELGIIYNNIALINARLGYEPKILQYGKMAIQQYIHARDTALLADGYANLGVSFKNLQSYDSALFYYRKSNELAGEIDSKWLLAKNLHNIGVLYDEMDKPDEAFDNYTASLKICTEENFPFGEFNNSVNLGDFALGRQDHQLAIRYLERARTLGREFGFDMLGQVYHKLHLAYCGSGDDKQALEYLRMYMHFKDSIVEAQKHKEIMELQTRYETQKKEAQILKLQKKQQSNALLRAYLLLVLVGVIIIALLLIMRSYKKHAQQKQNALRLEKENQQKQSRMEKLQLEKQLQEQAAERYRLDLKIREQELVYHTLREAGLSHLIKKLKDKLLPFSTRFARKKDQEHYAVALQEIALETAQDPLADFEEMFMQMHDGFYEKLLEINPDLTRSELQMAALLRMNLPSKEIARLLNLALSTIDKRRHHIRQKIGLSSDQSLSAFLISL
jgi:tetratricopeptide (TPR) repeat protein/DNA-binding CsgD family transcriptional regulator/Tfp pilus assembly protein PilN